VSSKEAHLGCWVGGISLIYVVSSNIILIRPFPSDSDDVGTTYCTSGSYVGWACICRGNIRAPCASVTGLVNCTNPKDYRTSWRGECHSILVKTKGELIIC